MAKRDYSIDRKAVKALVAVFGIREAARQAGIPRGTVASWCFRFGWKRAARVLPTNGINGGIQEKAEKDAADMLSEAIKNHKNESTLNLAHYAAKAAKAAVKAQNPLEVAAKVKDVAAVYRTIFPPESGGGLIEGQILIGALKVTDNHDEMLANARVLEDGRQKSEDGCQKSDFRSPTSDL